MAKNSGFRVTVMRWEWREPAPAESDAARPPEPVRGKPLQIHTVCNDCGATFSAYEVDWLRRGAFTLGEPGAKIQCSNSDCLQIGPLDLTGQI